ncbi:hypothetical protein [Pseudomonas sp. LP_7_YM]|nr:hypothetical protein [Pseudomonas sp. LP_7_YM]
MREAARGAPVGDVAGYDGSERAVSITLDVTDTASFAGTPISNVIKVAKK